MQALVNKKRFSIACYSINPKTIENITRRSGEYAFVHSPERKTATIICFLSNPRLRYCGYFSWSAARENREK